MLVVIFFHIIIWEQKVKSKANLPAVDQCEQNPEYHRERITVPKVHVVGLLGVPQIIL